MYVFNEKFNLTNDINIPYSLTEENLYPYTNTSGWVEDGKFVFAREGARESQTRARSRTSSQAEGD